jgi:hypothetical protein
MVHPSYMSMRVMVCSAAILISAQARTATLQWTRQFGTTGEAMGSAGHTSNSLGGPNLGGDDAYLRMYDASGATVWTRQFGTANYDYGLAVYADDLNNTYVTGDFDGPALGRPWNALLYKYDGSGVLQWSRPIGDGHNSEANGISSDGLGNVYVAGLAGVRLDPSSPVAGPFLAKFDVNGNRLWTRQFGMSGIYSINGVSADILGNVYIAGYTGVAIVGTTAGKNDAFIRKIDATGNVVWTRQFGTADDAIASGVSVDHLGNVYVSSTTGRFPPNDGDTGGEDIFLTKFNGSGDTLWSRRFDSGAGDLSRGLSVDAFGNAYVAGYSWGNCGSPNAGDRDACLLKYDPNGNLIWTQQFGTDLVDAGYGVSADGIGNVYLTGITEAPLFGPWDGLEDAFVVKIADTVPEPTTSMLLIESVLISLAFVQRIKTSGGRETRHTKV